MLDADLVIGAVLVPGARAPGWCPTILVARMKKGAVLVDIAIDQGGCFEDSRPTTHADPTYPVHDTVFTAWQHARRGSAHLPPRADQRHAALRAAAADKGWRDALHANPSLAHAGVGTGYSRRAGTADGRNANRPGSGVAPRPV